MFEHSDELQQDHDHADPELEHAYIELRRYVDSKTSAYEQARRIVKEFHALKRSIMGYDLLETIDPDTRRVKLLWIQRGG